MTLTMVRLTGGPLDGSTLGLEEPLAERVAGEELQDMAEALPAVRAALAGGEYTLRPRSNLYVWRDAVEVDGDAYARSGIGQEWAETSLLPGGDQ